MARAYQLKRRAERQDETRQRIVEATIELHQTIGPAATTVTEIAQRAGVRTRDSLPSLPRRAHARARMQRPVLRASPRSRPGTVACDRGSRRAPEDGARGGVRSPPAYGGDDDERPRRRPRAPGDGAVPRVLAARCRRPGCRVGRPRPAANALACRHARSRSASIAWRTLCPGTAADRRAGGGADGSADHAIAGPQPAG